MLLAQITGTAQLAPRYFPETDLINLCWCAHPCSIWAVHVREVIGVKTYHTETQSHAQRLMTTSTALAFLMEIYINYGWLDRVHTHQHIWTQIHKHWYRKNAPFFSIAAGNLIISVAVKWNDVLSLLIASMINLLLFHCNSIHTVSKVILCSYPHLCIITRSSFLYLGNRAPLVVILFHLCNYRALRFHYANKTGKDYPHYVALKHDITSCN